MDEEINTLGVPSTDSIIDEKTDTILTIDEPTIDTECTICLEKMGSSISYLECSHYFHKECISKWLEEHPTCPICRSRVHTQKDQLEITLTPNPIPNRLSTGSSCCMVMFIGYLVTVLYWCLH